ncbi:MAG: hypothetical protein SchgKO_13110 [Schleiferiaceae bacterium]|jgi:hypothetical protein
MENIKFPIAFATIYLFVYAALCGFDSTFSIAVFMFSLSPIPVIYMVYQVLTKGVESKKTFSDYFYDDVDQKRNH